jgi:hypothetical protein
VIVTTAPIRDAAVLVHRETGKILVFRDDGTVSEKIVILLGRLLRRI